MAREKLMNSAEDPWGLGSIGQDGIKTKQYSTHTWEGKPRECKWELRRAGKTKTWHIVMLGSSWASS